MRIAFDRIEYPAGEQLEEAWRRLAHDMRAQAIDRIARLQRRHHAADIVELFVHRALQDLASGF